MKKSSKYVCKNFNLFSDSGRKSNKLSFFPDLDFCIIILSKFNENIIELAMNAQNKMQTFIFSKKLQNDFFIVNPFRCCHSTTKLFLLV